MEVYITPGTLLNAASGLVLIGLGVFFWFVRPRRPGYRAFALFCVFFGLQFLVRNLFLPPLGVEEEYVFRPLLGTLYRDAQPVSAQRHPGTHMPGVD